jgi:hypothetical protein
VYHHSVLTGIRTVILDEIHIGGYLMSGDPQSPDYAARPVRIVSSSRKKDYRIAIRFPDSAPHWDAPDSF